MKTGFSTLWSSREQALPLLKAISEAGFHGMEPTFNAGAIPGPDNYSSEAPWLKQACSNLNLEIPSMRGGRLFWGTIPSPEPAERQKAVDHCRKALETVAMMGGDTLLLVPGEASPEIPFYDHRARVIEFIGRVVEDAANCGVKIALENTEARFPRSVQDWKHLLEEIGGPSVGMYMDVGNILWCRSGNPAAWIRELSPWIERIHFKDSFTGTCIVDILEGDVDWKSVMDTVREIGYDGWILLEPNWYRFAPELQPGQLAQRLQTILSL